MTADSNSLRVVMAQLDFLVGDIQGNAAKICGAGSIYRGGAGVILVVGDYPINELCQQFGYTVFDAQGDARGAHIF